MLAKTLQISESLLVDQAVYRTSKQGLEYLKTKFPDRLSLYFIEDERRKAFNPASEEEKARKELADIFFDKNKRQGKIMDPALKGFPVLVLDLCRLY